MVFLKPLRACLLMVAWGLCVQTFAEEKLSIYTSMRDSLTGELKIAFAKKYPEIKLDIQSAGAGKLMAKIAAERAAGGILADILWSSEVTDFYQLKAEGIFYAYIPAEAAHLINPLPDYDGSFTAVRLGTLGIAYNTTLIAKPPRSWDDLLKPQISRFFGIANPELSGTAYMSIAGLSDEFGWRFFEKLRARGARVGKGSMQVIEDTARGRLSACLAVDYIVQDMIMRGSNIAISYPPQMLVIPSPVAIFKNSRNIGSAKKFVDFLVSREGQRIIASTGTLPVRSDVDIPARFDLPRPHEAIRRAVKIDYRVALSDKEKILQEFFMIMQQ